MSAQGRFLPVTILSPDRRVIGESGHRNFDAKSRAYEFANGYLRPGAVVHAEPSEGLLATKEAAVDHGKAE